MVQYAINSKEVSKLIGKRHDNLLRTIRTEIKKLSNPEAFYKEATYTDGKGHLRECFEITVEGVKWLANRLPADKRKPFIDACMSEAKQTLQGDRSYTTKEVAELLGVSQRTVERKIKAGELKASKEEYQHISIRERMVIKADDLNEYVSKYEEV